MARSSSLHIGINRTGRGTPDAPERGTLRFCHTDAQSMADIARSHRYDSTVVLLDAEATFDRIIEEVNRAIRHIGDDGIFLWTFSGHGTIVPASEKGEEGRYDEGWVLCDGILLDNCIRALLAQFHERVAVIIVSDCCYSGDIARDLMLFAAQSGRDISTFTPDELPRAKQVDDSMTETSVIKPLRVRNCPYRSESIADIKAAVISIGACTEVQIAADGAFTPMLAAEVASGPMLSMQSYRGGYESLVAAVNRRLPLSQTPTLKTYGRRDALLLSGLPFAVPGSPAAQPLVLHPSLISIV